MSTPPTSLDPFHGRTRELAMLQAAWASSRSEFIPIYGRRRVGKSELIVKFLADRPGVFHVGKQAPAEGQQREFLEAAALALREPLLAQIQPAGWAETLRAVVDRWSGPGKLVLALDEFQWTAESLPELPSLLQELWDREWSRRGDVLLILCGSYVGFMEREVLGSRSPLFGRRTGLIHLQPFAPREARAFHPNYSLPEAARAWFVCGGVPMYLKLFRPDRSVAWNARKTLLDPHGALFREAEFLLREELREVATYHAVLTALTAGSSTLSELARESGVAPGSISYYVDQLVGLGYVRRRYPLTGKPPKRRAVRFALADPLLRFWFRFVFPHMSLVTRLGPEAAWDRLVKPQWEAWCGARFEDLCRELLPVLWQEEDVAGREVGEYWDKAAQIDVVGSRDDGWIDIGECKWRARVRPGSVAEAVAERATRLPNPENLTVQLRVFAQQSVDVEVAQGLGVTWHGLRELYGSS